MILLHLTARDLPGGGPNPKNYPHAEELKKLIGEGNYHEITGPIPLEASRHLIEQADAIVCVDSYLQHLAWSMGHKAIVLWGMSDPKIFGHEEHLNLLVDRKYLRKEQFSLYTNEQYYDEAFVSPYKVIAELKNVMV